MNTHEKNHSYWTGIMEEFKKNSLSKRAYCSQHALKLTTFKNWYYRLGYGIQSVAEKKALSFVPLKIIDTDMKEEAHKKVSYFRLQLKSPFVLEIPVDLPSGQLKPLFSSIGVI